MLSKRLSTFVVVALCPLLMAPGDDGCPDCKLVIGPFLLQTGQVLHLSMLPVRATGDEDQTSVACIVDGDGAVVAASIVVTQAGRVSTFSFRNEDSDDLNGSNVELTTFYALLINDYLHHIVQSRAGTPSAFSSKLISATIQNSPATPPAPVPASVLESFPPGLLDSPSPNDALPTTECISKATSNQ